MKLVDNLLPVTVVTQKYRIFLLPVTVVTEKEGIFLLPLLPGTQSSMKLVDICYW